MKPIENQSYFRFKTSMLPPGQRSIGGTHFRKCSFEHCALSGGRDPGNMLTVHEIRIENCKVKECGLSRLVLVDVILENLDMSENDLLCVWGSFFKHVVLRGLTGNINLNGLDYDSQPHLIPPPLHAAFERERYKFYENIDWALDIREASVFGIQIDGIPAHLVRRDPATQALIRREKLENNLWQNVNLEDTWWKAMIRGHLSTGVGDIILVAPRRDPSFAKQLDGIKRLRDAGIAELD